MRVDTNKITLILEGIKKGLTMHLYTGNKQGQLFFDTKGFYVINTEPMQEEEVIRLVTEQYAGNLEDLNLDYGFTMKWLERRKAYNLV